MEEAILTDRLIGGDMIAFGEIYRMHREPLVSFARLFVGGASKAEDIVQEVFLKLWSNHEHLKAGSALRPYLVKAVYNTSMNFLRDDANKAIFRNEYARRIELEAASCYDPDTNEVIKALFTRDALATVEEAMALLPEAQRNIFRMSYFEGLSHKQIARKLGISVRTVESHVYKALKTLRKNLTKELFFMVVSLPWMHFFK